MSDIPAVSLPFAKLSGGGNDFILIDERRTTVWVEPARLAAALCRRAQSVGADGLLVVGASSEADLSVVFYNPDGSRAFCGNGTLCAGRWAHAVAGLRETLRLETDRGIVPVRVRGARVEMDVAPPTDWREGIPLAPAGRPGHGVHLNTGCPHLVVLAAELPEDDAFLAEARALRHHAELGDVGANVDFAEVADSHRLRLRTFERGVEGETLASGTGCLAAVLAAASRGLVISPVTCLVRGGQPLTVRFTPLEDGFRDVSLEGEARVVYTGITTAEAFAGA
jgi:diaminopimelate epimerase